eukprot:TRINITY_DN3140_c0_g1_i1.p1 TRINITY_DN3140_c0_g1~~TRINITY_DN3140_c0_g1_i1.p1  ORF type:complete len:661 (-),score=156.38 TRINITY_DN3140_c0_g1_i1:40-2022(-)
MQDNIKDNSSAEERDRVRLDTTDPYLRNRPQSQSNKLMMSLSVVAVTLISWFLLLICLGVDNLTNPWTMDGATSSHYHYDFHAFIYTLLNPSPGQSRAVMQSVMNDMAFIFGLLVTFMGITMQFASERTTSHVITLFIEDKIVRAVLGLSVISNAFAAWIYLEVGYYHTPRCAVVVTIVAVTVELVILFPFLAYLFVFLETEKVATNLMMNGLNAVVGTINTHSKDTNIDEEKRKRKTYEYQTQTILSIEYLMDAAISSIKKKQRNVAAEIVDALCSFCMHYVSNIKPSAPAEWFRIPIAVQQSPDFLILNAESVEEIYTRHMWVEWKVLRQYQTLFQEGLRWFKETCYHVCINTRIIAETAAMKGDMHVLDLCVKFFNTFLRASINLSDQKVVYNCLFQYRQLAENLLNPQCVTADLAARSLKIAKFTRYYAWACNQRGLIFLVETVAQDLRALCQVSVRHYINCRATAEKNFQREMHDKLLQVLLSISDIVEFKRGVIRAQIMLAVYYISEDQNNFASLIKRQVDRPENKNLLMSLNEELKTSATSEFWEVSERGKNFTYMEPRLRPYLQIFYDSFGWYQQARGDEWTQFLRSKEGTEFKIQQELNNFEANISELNEDEDEYTDDDEYDEEEGQLGFDEDDDAAQTARSAASSHRGSD